MFAVIALSMALASADAWQKLAGPGFERFAAQADASCPGRQLRFVTPADLDYYQEDFIARLPHRQRSQLARADRREPRCTSGHGLSCPSTRKLDAMARVAELDAFVAFACHAPEPVNTVTTEPRP